MGDGDIGPHLRPELLEPACAAGTGGRGHRRRAVHHRPGGRGFAGGGFGGSGGIGRLFSAEYGGQVAWLIPAALIALAVMLWVSRRAPRTDRTRAAALLWGGWLVVAGLVLSFMSGISHTYYVVALTPATGALAGIGAVKLWEARGSWLARFTLAVALLLTGGWAWVLLDRSPGWYPWLRVVIIIAALGAAGDFARDRFGTGTRTSRDGADFRVAGGFGGVGAFGGAVGTTSVNPAMTKLLETGARGYKWAAAIVGSDSAASLELGAGGVPVMAVGGFSGTDPAPALAEFQQMVAARQVHYFILGGGRGGAAPVPTVGPPAVGSPAGELPAVESPAGAGSSARGGTGVALQGGSDTAQVEAWVEGTFTAATVGGETVYDLSAPKAGSS